MRAARMGPIAGARRRLRPGAAIRIGSSSRALITYIVPVGGMRAQGNRGWPSLPVQRVLQAIRQGGRNCAADLGLWQPVVASADPAYGPPGPAPCPQPTRCYGELETRWTVVTEYGRPWAWQSAHDSTPPDVWLAAWANACGLSWHPVHAAVTGGSSRTTCPSRITRSAADASRVWLIMYESCTWHSAQFARSFGKGWTAARSTGCGAVGDPP